MRLTGVYAGLDACLVYCVEWKVLKARPARKSLGCHQPRHGPHLPSRLPLQRFGNVPQLRDRGLRESEGGERAQKLGAQRG